MAAKQAKARAQAIASGIGASLGAVVFAQEGGGVTVRALTNTPDATTHTPIETGLVQIQATVSIQVELIP
jgi:uncharacterized protein YggE